MNKFKPGDKVVCIDDGGAASYYGIFAGLSYEVEKYHVNEPGEMHLVGISGGSWRDSRFELADWSAKPMGLQSGTAILQNMKNTLAKVSPICPVLEPQLQVGDFVMFEGRKKEVLEIKQKVDTNTFLLDAPKEDRYTLLLLKGGYEIKLHNAIPWVEPAYNWTQVSEGYNDKYLLD